MSTIKNNFNCRVCGHEQLSPPWGTDGMTPIFEICDCCGCEFGYEDSTIETIKMYRQKWINKGQKWFLDKKQPKNWDLQKQITLIPKEFL